MKGEPWQRHVERVTIDTIVQTKAVDTLRYADGPPGQDATRAEVTCARSMPTTEICRFLRVASEIRRIDTLRPSDVSDQKGHTPCPSCNDRGMPSAHRGDECTFLCSRLCLAHHRRHRATRAHGSGYVDVDRSLSRQYSGLDREVSAHIPTSAREQVCHLKYAKALGSLREVYLEALLVSLVDHGFMTAALEPAYPRGGPTTRSAKQHQRAA